MYQRILVPIDGSDTSSRGLVEAIALAKLTGGCLCLLHVVDDMTLGTGWEGNQLMASELIPLLRASGAKGLAEAKARVAAAGVDVETVLVETFAGRVAELVRSQAKAWRADLIVIGTHGRRGIGRMLLGSDAEQVVRLAPVPVLLVRAEPIGGTTEPARQAANSTTSA